MELEIKQIVKINSKTKSCPVYITAENVRNLNLKDGQEIIIKVITGGDADAQPFLA